MRWPQGSDPFAARCYPSLSLCYPTRHLTLALCLLPTISSNLALYSARNTYCSMMYPPTVPPTPVSVFTYPSTQPDETPDLHKLFHHVDETTLHDILNHELPAAELYKLDTRRILESQWHIVDLEDSSVSFRCMLSAREIYQTIDSLLVPLNTYFSILSVHGLSNGLSPTLPYYFFRYSSHLIKISQQYEWPAVLLYHFAFFARRSSEMVQGEYSGWEKIDVDLMEELLVQHRKQPEVRPHSFSPSLHAHELAIARQIS